MNNNKRHKSIETLNDRHIYNDGKNHIYADAFTGNKGYILTSKETESYAIYSSRVMLGLSFGIILFFVLNQLYLAIAVGLTVYVALEVLFRVRFLKNCPVIENYNRPKNETILHNLVTKYSRTRLILMLIFSLGIVVLIPINVKVQNYEGILIYANYLICLMMFVVAIVLIIAIIKKAKIDK